LHCSLRSLQSKVLPSTAEIEAIRVVRRRSSTARKLCAHRLSGFLDHLLAQTFFAIALAATLFLPDLWVILNPSNDVDILLNATLLVLFVAFSCEIIVT
jgi:hypothetical protein